MLGQAQSPTEGCGRPVSLNVCQKTAVFTYCILRLANFFFAQSPSWSGMCRCPANTPPLARFALLQFGARRRFEPNRAPSKFCSPDFWSRSECTLRNATAIWRKFCEHSDSRAHPEAKACARTVFSTASRRYGKIRQQSRARSLRTADPKTQCKGF